MRGKELPRAPQWVGLQADSADVTNASTNRTSGQLPPVTLLQVKGHHITARWQRAYKDEATRSTRGDEHMAKMKRLRLVLGVSLCLGIAASVVRAYAQQIDRTQLPTPDTQYKYPGKVPLDARDAKFPPIKLLRPPEGAPNVVVVLLDDIGFGAPSTFGGGANRPPLGGL